MAFLKIKQTSYRHIQIAEEICLKSSAPFKEIKRSLTKRGGKEITAFPWQIDPVPLAEVSLEKYAFCLCHLVVCFSPECGFTMKNG